jgi:selenide,water dikinase
LSKPLGLGVTTTALKNGTAKTEDVEQAVSWMNMLNADAAELAVEHEIKAATDITGFGLLGHGLEMAESSGVELQVYVQSVPFLKGARAYAEAGNFPGGSADNQVFFGDRVKFSPTIDEYNRMMLFDAQTSGGLLLALPEDKVESFFKSAGAARSAMWAIGRVRKGNGITVEDTRHNLPLPVEVGDKDLWFSTQ